MPLNSREPQRVFAIRDADDKTVNTFGVGTYVGDEPDSPIGIANPKIELDNGGVVWGCECWWGPESRYEETVQGRVVVELPAPHPKEN